MSSKQEYKRPALYFENRQTYFGRSGKSTNKENSCHVKKLKGTENCFQGNHYFEKLTVLYLKVLYCLETNLVKAIM